MDTAKTAVTVTIYTDGACLGNPGPGGWGAVLQYGSHEKEISGFDPDTTNNRMELTAAIKSLELLTRAATIDLYTDSTYVKNGITSWLANWEKNGWKTSDRKPVKNADLWQRLSVAVARHTIDWRWVKGHAGHPLNERADALATTAARSGTTTS